MTTLVSRAPLLPLSMSSMQRAPRRLSARLAEKEDTQHSNGVYPSGVLKSTRRGGEITPANNKKRKLDYDEEDDGFTFTRVKKQKPRVSAAQQHSVSDGGRLAQDSGTYGEEQQIGKSHVASEMQKKRRNKMSFSTPKLVPEEKPTGRSRRVSTDKGLPDGSPRHKIHREHEAKVKVMTVPAEPLRKQNDAPPVGKPPEDVEIAGDSEIHDRSGTKIALPFADTPVIRRNKAMREGKSVKGDRRSSLGLRGRRASSLIESGTSNGKSQTCVLVQTSELTLDTALPHAEVEVQSFYKHIDCESLLEPKRMRQLLTWCATRALGEKPSGIAFEDVSIKQAARVIQEELLKDFANQSEMSDWFGREDNPKPAEPVPERAHPKNIQNSKRIHELEEQIRRLKVERQSTESLLRPPAIPPLPEVSPYTQEHAINISLLSPSDAALLDSLSASSSKPPDISSRLNSIGAALGPTIDAFADGIHKMAQYRDAAEKVASRTLAICAEKLGEREREGDLSPRRNLDSVLRGLSRVDR